MILKGSQRSGGIALANHLLNHIDNDHVEIHELRGFVADDLKEAFKEAYAISLGTRCKQFLFSLSLSPPQTELVPVGAFEDAIDRIEDHLNLKNHARAIVFHEKEGRRHAHVVWSRVDIRAMRAVNLSFFESKLQNLSRDLYIEHGWLVPKGLQNKSARDPFNFSLVEWQQAKRIKADPKQLKRLFQECWAASDGVSAFAQALEGCGFILAKGDRRGHVAVGWRGEVYAVARWVGVKTKDIRAKLGDPSTLPSIDQAKVDISRKMDARLKRLINEQIETHQIAELEFDEKLRTMRVGQRQAREQLIQSYESKRWAAARVRSSQMPTGLKALWFRLTGRYATMQKRYETENSSEQTAYEQASEALRHRQLLERQELQHDCQRRSNSRPRRRSKSRPHFMMFVQA